MFREGQYVKFKKVEGELSPDVLGRVVLAKEDYIMVEWHYSKECRLRSGFGPERQELLEYVR